MKINWHNIRNFFFAWMGEKGMRLMLIMISGGDGVICIRDTDPLSVGIVPLNWFVSFSGLSRMPIYSNSRSLPGRLGTHLAKQRVEWMHKHTPAKVLKWCAVMYKCTVTADCWFYSLYASTKEALTHCFRFHWTALHISSAVCCAWPEIQSEITQWLTGLSERENIIIF